MMRRRGGGPTLSLFGRAWRRERGEREVSAWLLSSPTGTTTTTTLLPSPTLFSLPLCSSSRLGPKDKV